MKIWTNVLIETSWEIATVNVGLCVSPVSLLAAVAKGSRSGPNRNHYNLLLLGGSNELTAHGARSSSQI